MRSSLTSIVGEAVECNVVRGSVATEDLALALIA